MRRQICDSVEELLGNTPLVRLNNLSPNNGASLFAKLESFNPSGSVKDRMALNMIRDAENRGELKPGGTIVEPSSGNTALSLALWSKRLGYRFTAVMPDANNIGLRKMLRAMGAVIELTQADAGLRGARNRVKEICGRKRNCFFPDQFNNPSNPEIHRNTTAREIIKAMAGKKIDALVVGVGTGGTITGLGEALKAKFPRLKVVAVEPAESPVLSGGKPGMHFIDGIGPGFIPPVLNREIIDEVITVSSEESRQACHKILLEEGVISGASSGAAYVAARKTASKMKRSQNVVAFFADAKWGVN